jgi:hypothetical protein
VRQRFNPMLGFKNIANRAVTISGIEVMLKIKKSRFDIEKSASGVKVRAPRMWMVDLPLDAKLEGGMPLPLFCCLHQNLS